MADSEIYNARQKQGLLFAASIGFAVVQLDVSAVTVALPAIGRALESSVSGLQWVIGAYTLALAALLLTGGTLCDRFGAKRLFMTGFLLFTGSSFACGLAPSSTLLISARSVQGLGAALLLPCSLSLISHGFISTKERLRAVGIWAACASIALAGGPIVGGILTAAIGWRAIFFINLPIGLAGLIASARFARETPGQPDKALDPGGQISAIVCLVSLTWAMIESGNSGLHLQTAAGFAVAACSAVIFLQIERHQRQPMLNLGLFRNRIFRSMILTGLCLNIGFYGLMFVLSLFFQQVQQASALRAGLLFAPMTAAVFAGNIAAPRFAGRNRARAAMLGAALLMVCGGMVLLLLHIQQHTAFTALLVPLIVIGFGLGTIVPLMTASLLGSVVHGVTGIASGTLNMARQIGSVIGVSLFGSMIAGGGLLPGFHRVLALYAATMACAYFLIRAAGKDLL